MARTSVILALLVAIGAGGLFAAGPREPAVLDTPRVELPDDLGVWLAQREAGVRPDLQARIVRAGATDRHGDLVIVYVHGFSGSPVEMQPLPERVAAELDADLLLVRLTGHGLDGAAMGEMRADDWWRDVAEAVAVARRLGPRVVLIGTSTGGTLVAEAARDPVLGRQLAGAVLISPNFEIRQFGARLLDLPFARQWMPWVLGRDRCFDVVDEAHSLGWTQCYPNVALLPMVALLRHARQGDFRRAVMPSLFIWSDRDTVVDHRASRRVADSWGGPATVLRVDPGPNDDPSAHLIAGDTLSPDLTPQIIEAIVGWVRGLPISE